MAKIGRTWWGQRFIEALEGFTDSGRLQRGKGYSGDRRILGFGIAKGMVTATVRGNANLYYGVHKKPRYKTKIRMAPIPSGDWTKAIAHLGSNAALVSKLLMNEMPDSIDDAFADVKLHLLPRSYYRLASQLDSDPCPTIRAARPLARAAALGLERKTPGYGSGYPDSQGVHSPHPSGILFHPPVGRDLDPGTTTPSGRGKNAYRVISTRPRPPRCPPF